jgi:transcriptional regulator with XRE-family HTH domain
MASALPNYLRMYRKRSGFSQAEMAFLLGAHGAAKVSRYEHGRRLPTLKTILAYELVLHAHSRDLFAGVFREVEGVTKRRAATLAKRLAGQKSDLLTMRKIQILNAIAETKSLDS